MYLKSIKAYGFKSFADKIEINFNENINGIVGPNGSGKSNVVDAVKWVLGEQSIKSLRGESSADIIFQGSKSRKPLNSASVTLVFDNTDMYLPINYNEVSIKRIMYKSGENEYYLNNEKCRLKDINDLLTDSGAGRDSFNIISQGKIDEILSTKATDRRTIFESAAGVLKYKKRKEEAYRKLERTNTNLDRVNDIIKELETNLKPLEKQSEDAKIYLEHKEKLKNIEIALIANDIETYNNETKITKEKIEKLNDEISTISTETTKTDVDLLSKKEKLKELETNINNKQNSLIESTKKIEKTDADIRILKERKKYSKEYDKISENIINIKSNILETTNNINNITNELNQNITKLNNIKETLEIKTTTYNDLKTKQNNITKTITNNTRQLTNLKYKIEYLENNIQNNFSIPNSIKQILNNPRLSGYHNVIGKLINIDDLYNQAIITSLGASTNYLVVNTTEDAKIMVNYLKENKLGRATFYPLDAIKGKNIDNDTLSKITLIPGFINTADKLVTYDPIYKNIITNRLGNIIIATDINSATYIGKFINNRYKVVTLDGQEINVGGSITGGSSVNNNIIKEKYELETNKQNYETLEKENKELILTQNKLDNQIISSEEEIHNNKLIQKELEENIYKNRTTIETMTQEKEQLERELKDLNAINNNNEDAEESKLLENYYKSISIKDNITNEISTLKNERDNLNDNIVELESLSKKNNTNQNEKEREIKQLEIKLNTMNIKLDNLLLSLTEEYNITFDHALNNYKLELNPSEARIIVREIKDKIKNIDFVNLGAIEEYDRVKTRYDFLSSQKEDLHKAEDTLLEIINEMDTIMKDKFIVTFEQIRTEFKKVFKEMFRGGEAELILTDPDNILETGIEIEAVPSGKNLKSLSLLSGGEKTFTAISLLFAILNVRPVPFCLLDEVEAALDDANVESFGNYLYKYKSKTQFILITHKKKTMEFADILYGITMQESGVSKLVSVKLEDLKKEGEKNEK